MVHAPRGFGGDHRRDSVARPALPPSRSQDARRFQEAEDRTRIGGEGGAEEAREGQEKVKRCAWPGSDELYLQYHDLEWGRPVTDDRRLFEKICLEGFQSGLSWITILRKRENFRRAFHAFEPAVVARFGPRDVQRLLKDAG